MRRKRAARLGFAERDARRHDLIAENIAALALRKVDRPFFELRVTILCRPDPHTSYHHISPLKNDGQWFTSDKLRLTPAERPVFAFHFDEIDYKVLRAQPNAFAQAICEGSVEAPLNFSVTTFVQRHLDHDRISGAFDPEVGLTDHKVDGRMLGEDVESLFQRDLERRMHGLLNRFTHRRSILGRFASRQFNANEGHRFVSYRDIAPSGEAVAAIDVEDCNRARPSASARPKRHAI